jgi:trk system potassium uptake protein TrkH
MKSSLRRVFAALSQCHPIRLVALGYSSYILLGWLVLCLPWLQQTGGVGWLDHLFIAASAVSTTGLTTVSTADTYNLAGELAVLVLIQLGGIGYMTAGSFLVLSVSGKLSATREKISAAAFSLPDGFEVKPFLKVICWFTLGIEAVGACALYPTFAAHGAASPWWQAVFHSVSAFCTAGFGLFNDSFESYRSDAWMNLVISVLSYAGAIGFIVFADLWKSLTHRKPHVTFTSRIILASTIWIAVIGTLLFALDEPSIQALPAAERWMAAFFQVMTASTTVGFNTIPIGALSASSLFLLTIVMMIGASPSGTGGGIKTTGFTALWAAMVSVVRQREVVTFMHREIPRTRLRAASASLMFYLLTFAAGIYALALVEKSPLPDLMFEAASALGTVGLSRGITGSLTPLGKGIIIALMWAGRIGPVMLGMAIFSPTVVRKETVPGEDVAI